MRPSVQQSARCEVVTVPMKEVSVGGKKLYVFVLPGTGGVGADIVLVDPDLGARSMRSNTELFNKLLRYGADLSVLEDVANFLDKTLRELML